MKKLMVIVAVLAVSGTAVGWWYLRANGATQTTFRTAVVERGRLEATIAATGTLQPEEVVDVGAQVAGRIEYLGKDPDSAQKVINWGSEVDGPVLDDEGNVVKPGTVLAQIDKSLYLADMLAAKAEWDRAKADLLLKKAQFEQAAKDWKRASDLRPQNGISQAEYDAAQATHKTTEANVAISTAQIAQTEAAFKKAETNLRYTTITSPVKGVIIDRRINVGQTVVASLSAPSLFLIAKDLSKMEVWAQVNEADIGKIKVDQPVQFKVDSLPGKVFKGKVVRQGKFPARLNANMVQNVVTYTVVVSADNPPDETGQRQLVPYTTANLEFKLGEKLDALLVPNAALRWQPTKKQLTKEALKSYAKVQRDKRGGEADGQERGIVWVTDDGVLRPILVKIGASDGVNTDILAGDLHEKMEVVIGDGGSQSNNDGGNPFAPKMFGGGSKKQD
jgi:HlyD family secretion protein